MRRVHALLLLLSALFAFTTYAEEELLEPDQAFRLEVTALDAETLRAEWTVADGYYLYRSKFQFRSDTPGIEFGTPRFPAGKIKNDEFFGEVEIYHGRVSVELPVVRGNTAAAMTLKLTTTSQGCAEQGVCYPPHRQSREVALPASAKKTSASPRSALLGGLFGGGEEEVLDPEQAFRFDTEVVDAGTIVARWQIAPAHYLYKDKFKFELLDAAGVQLGAVSLPEGEEKEDEFFGRIRVFHDQVEARLALQREDGAARKITLRVSYQGCAEAGICYPPMKKESVLSLPAGSATAIPTGGAGTSTAVASTVTPSLSEQDTLALSLASGDTLVTILTFFGLGLLLAFTPCVFPMIPILSSIIVGQGEGLTTRRAFTLSAVYVIAMALTYTVAGVIAGLFGANLQATFQNPWILGSFSLVFVLLALSMFGFYELQLPSALQSRLATLSNRQQSGSVAGVAIMGLLSALIVGPCVAPPLMGALIYIGQTGDPWLGGSALFALSLGMGAPLLAIGTSAGKLLPRAGGWMNAVKGVFGVMLLAVAVWMLERILPGGVVMVLWALLLVVPAIYMGALEPVAQGSSGWKKLWKGLGLMMLIHGGLLLIGAAGGSTDPLQPLRGFGLSAAGGSAALPAHLEFKTIKTSADLDRELAAAGAQGKPVMLDFYADWCVSCKELEKYTFSDPQVQRALTGTVLLQADVTANDEADQVLLKRFGLIGPPAVLFFGSDGAERSPYRLIGYLEAVKFEERARQALGS